MPNCPERTKKGVARGSYSLCISRLGYSLRPPSSLFAGGFRVISRPRRPINFFSGCDININLRRLSAGP